MIVLKRDIFKKAVSIAAAAAITVTLCGGCSAAGSGTDDIKVTYDGQTIELDAEPEIINDRVMVPMRAIFEAFGAKVKWDGESKTITSKKKSKTITMTIDSCDMTKNDETYTFDTAPVIENGRTLVPVRAISDLLGLDAEWDEESRTVTITTPAGEEDNEWEKNTGTIDLDKMSVTGDGVSVSGKVITIASGGDFTVTGECADGQIVVDTEDKAKLRLSGMSLTNTDGAAIYVKNADKAYITVSKDTENSISDGASYASGDENEKAAITSRDNLEIKGNGSLTVNASYNNGIDCSDSLDIENGSITVNAVNDGINVNDTLAVSGGTLTVNAKGDGMQAGEIIDVSGGELNITTTGEVASSTSETRGFGRFGQIETLTDTAQTDAASDASSKGIKADWLVDISGGTLNLTTTDHAIHCTSDMEISGGDITISSDNKGISAHGSLTFNGGKVNITKSTEGIETKTVMTINDGDISVTASDDGINAGGGNTFGGMGRTMVQPDGQTMPNGTERPASGDMTPPNDGTGEMRHGGRGMRSDMTTPDGQPMPDGQMPTDRMTPPDGQTPPEMPDGQAQQMQGGGMRGGMGMNRDSSEVSTEHHIQINGGTVYINAMGDGIDSNGSIVMDGGTVTIDGTTFSGNGALDHDGAMMVNGGTLTAVSAAGMVEAPGSASTQNVLCYTLSENAEAGTKIEVKKANGTVIASHTGKNAYQSFIFSSPELVTGETYTIYVNGEEKDSFTVSDAITNVGSAAAGGMRGGHGMNGMNRNAAPNENAV